MSAPSRLGDYELIAELGRGSMGVVYRAVDRRLRREVALKLLLGDTDEASLEAFLKEARAAARLRHPGIVVVYSVEVIDGKRAVAFELVDGGSLAERLERERVLPSREAVRIVAELASAVHVAHEQGIVHRDLKPANVLLEKKDGRARLTDFGLARDSATRGVTERGDLVGTPVYMAPEQARGDNERVSPRTDVFALGAILFACLSGRPPYWGPNVATVIRNVIEAPVPSLVAKRRAAGLEPLPSDIVTICDKALAKDPAARYESAAALEQDLRRWLEGRPIVARPQSWLEHAAQSFAASRRAIATGLAVAALASVAAIWLPTTIARARRRADAERVLASTGVGSGKLSHDAALFELTKEPESAPVELLAATVEETAKRAAAVTRARLLGVREASSDAERARQPRLAGLETALDELARAQPQERLAPATIRVLDEARRRLALRIRTANVTRPELLLAAEQRTALGEDQHLRALVAIEALGRLGAVEAAPALGRFLDAIEDEDDALVAVTALGRLHDQRAIQCALAVFDRVRRGPNFQHRALHALWDQLGDKVPAWETRVAQDWVDRAQLRFHAGDEAGARADIDKAIALDPRSAAPWDLRADHWLARHEPRRALEDLDRALALDPDAAVNHARRAIALSALERGAEAIVECSRAIDLDPLDPRPWNVRGACELDERPALAADDFRRALELDSRYADAWVNSGLASALVGDVKGALVAFERAIGLDPTSAAPYGHRGMARAELGQYDEALADCNKAVELAPRDARSWAHRAYCRTFVGDFAGAQVDADRAVELGPQLGEAYVVRARVRIAQHDLEGARADALRGTALAPRDPHGWFVLSQAELQHGDPAAAVAALDRQLELQPGEPRALDARARIKLRMGDAAGGLADLAEAIRSPRVPPEVLIGNAETLEQLGHRREAREAFDHLVAAAPLVGMAWAARAQHRLRTNRLDDALDDALRATELAPRDPLCLYALGSVRAARHEDDLALIPLRKILETSDPRWDVSEVRALIAEIEKRRPR